jgi:hypothetical protein
VADLQLSTVDDDLDLTGEQLSIVDGDDAIIQHLLIRLRFFTGEWFLDTRVGLPYYDSILVKNPDLVFIRSLFRKAIIKTPGIAGIDSLTTAYDGTTRKLTVSFSAVKDDGEVLDFSKEFIIP